MGNAIKTLKLYISKTDPSGRSHITPHLLGGLEGVSVPTRMKYSCWLAACLIWTWSYAHIHMGTWIHLWCYVVPQAATLAYCGASPNPFLPRVVHKSCCIISPAHQSLHPSSPIQSQLPTVNTRHHLDD